MARRKQDAALDLTTLPLLTTRRVCILADCHRSTVKRSTLRPVGKRGRTLIYKTADVLAWMSGAIDDERTANDTAPIRTRAASPSENALDRIASLRRGGSR